MAEKFSSVLKLTELDDFITPSQECIKPVIIDKKNTSTQFTIESDGSYVETTSDGEKVQMEKATITLNDCLACSGCITSAESVLISAQSTVEFSNVLKSIAESKPDSIVVVSISPQSRASLANHFGIDSMQLHRKLVTFLKSIGVNHVFDTSFSREFALIESAEEFIARYKQTYDKPLPMLASACPGWICYAEKTHGDYVLPYISTTKSPQQIMGTLVKYYLSKKINTLPSNIYHVTIMPCYDKKLEASRSDFYNDVFKTKDVDCVLSTSEVLELLKEHGDVDLLKLEEATLDNSIFNNVIFNQQTGQPEKFLGVTGSTGGYFEYLFRRAAKELFGKEIEGEIEYKVGRNTDFKEASLEVDGKKVLSFAKAYGFRNIQNIVRKIKTTTASSSKKEPQYHFVEVMACPSGCINGGGQIKAASGSLREQKLLIEQSEQKYYQDLSIQSYEQLPSTLEIKDIYDQWMNGPFSLDAKTKLHTQYHMIEKSKNALSIKW
ncbi:nuclear prelamin A recognition factor-like protein [Cavenderia fasciculata]|uniref:Nuclear prelamin A recognition factor-like protein n=1 Tax=Cavenderia fasciculata TaxID=261658 RepID=F4Q417_CACFS|nr:nuclear prelamin A recognition factor-like protein [Cavenderia fasciculata]EGG16931.1 nuclear prelamin A recognition factor-like protein [Cavenderia fasciculata]|eukprot:XP_004355405.1 nuclear prelamin A recognition factor-like protein [Cavenderia fasciculata]